MIQIATNHIILAAITPAMNPESEEAVPQPIFNLYVSGSRETKSLKIFIVLF
jgi:hypothetical protein